MKKTQTISVRELRQNLSLCLRATELKNVHFIIMRHSRTIAKIVPEKKQRRQTKEEFFRDMKEIMEQMDRGEYYTTEEVEQHLRKKHSRLNGRKKRMSK